MTKLDNKISFPYVISSLASRILLTYTHTAVHIADLEPDCLGRNPRSVTGQLPVGRARILTSPCLRFLICRMELITVPTF